MYIPENSNTKRISIDLPEELISRFDQLRKEWGLRSRGPVIEKLLTDLLQEDDLIPKNHQQEIDFSDDKIKENYDVDENKALVLIKSENKEEIEKISVKVNDEIEEKHNSKIRLPNFVEKKVKNLRRSIYSEKIKGQINDVEINSIKEHEIIRQEIELNERI